MGDQHTHEGQEQPTPAAPAEVDPVSLEQQTSQVALPTDITASSAPPPDLADLPALLLDWVRTPDWTTSQRYLLGHRELLTEAAEHLLTTLIQIETDERARTILTERWQLLQMACQEGIEATYMPLLDPAGQAAALSNGLEDLEADLVAWIKVPDWAASQSYLEAHPRLLTELAEQLLEQFIQVQPAEEAREFLSTRQVLLHDARVWGVPGTYTYYQLADQVASIKAHERAAMLGQVQAWLAAPTWAQSQAYMEAHPRLFARSNEFLLAWLWQMQQTNEERVHLAQHLQLLQRARKEGSDAAYRQLPDPDAFNKAGIDAIRHYQLYGNTEYLVHALECWQQALMLILPDASTRPKYLNNLGSGMGNLYTLTGALTDLETSISAFQQAVGCTPLDSPNSPLYLNNFGQGLLVRYERTRVREDLETAIRAFRQVIDITPADAPDYPGRLSNLGRGLQERYRLTMVLDDLETAILAYQQALDLTPLDVPDRPALLNNLGLGLGNRYERTGALGDLEAAIIAYQQALDHTPPDAPDRSMYLSNLGTRLRDRYEYTGVLADLEAATRVFKQALDLTPPASLTRPALLNNLGLGLGNRYESTGALGDLEATILAYQQALDLTPPDAPDRSMYLNNLGIWLSARYHRTGDLADLETAIHTFQEGLDRTPPDSSYQSSLLSNLGNGMSNRYRRTGSLTDLDAAITAFQKAVDITPPGAPARPGRLNNLGNGLLTRYDHTGSLTDLDAAITAFQKAVDITPPGAPARPGRLNNLGNGLRGLYISTGDLANLDAAITTFQQALDLTSSDNPDRPLYLTNLGNGFSDRYISTGDLTQLEAAISVYQQALDTTPPDAPARQAYLDNLGDGLSDRYGRTGAPADLEAALAAWEAIWFARYTRFEALPVLYQLGQQRQEGGVSAKLITASLELAAHSRPIRHTARRRAFEVAEGSKSRLLTQLVGRGPLPLPLEFSPQAADREQQLLRKLTILDTQDLASQNLLVTEVNGLQGPNHLQKRQVLVQKLEQLWISIARLGADGAEYVALRRGKAPTWHDLTRLAKVLGSTTALLSLFTVADRSLFFILRAGWRVPRVIETPLNQDGWSDLLSRFFREVHRYQPGARRGETWDQPLHPLMAQAQHHLVGVERLILAPAGNGHLLPWALLVERAGWQTPNEQLISLVTLPALGILPRLRQRQRNVRGPALVVGNPISDLPSAEAEAKEVAQRFGTRALLRTQATRAEVLSLLAEASLVHLATHAFFDPRDPLDSGIVLADGILTAREVLKHRLQADLLVLSACQSGQVGSLGGEELAGLSQIFLQAGVRSLLVSLWSVNDPATAALMQAFYDARENGADKAQALRQAMTQIQQDPRWSHPYYWGAFVLMGDWE